MEDKGRGTMKGMKALVVVLILMGMVLVTASPALAVAVGPYEVSFVTVRYNYPTDGHSTWFYTATSPSDDNAISHMVFQLGACCSVTDAGEWTMLGDGSFVLDSWWGTGKIDVTQDPTTGIFGIKFDDGFTEGETRNYYFTVVGNHAVDYEAITVAIKTGGGTATLMNGTSLLASVSGLFTRVLGILGGNFTTYEAFISGPALDCHETTAVSLSSFSAFAPLGPSAAALLMPGSLLAALALIPTSVVLAARRMRREER
jgi:hypothetical protein